MVVLLKHSHNRGLKCQTVVAFMSFVCNWNFHFACPATGEYIPECPARHLFRVRSNGEDRIVPCRSLAQVNKL
jgi:hypothetical protein